jgi:hypothetical protein
MFIVGVEVVEVVEGVEGVEGNESLKFKVDGLRLSGSELY